MKAATVLSAFSSSIATFQSTPPVKAATPRSAAVNQLPSISIHAAREGGDAVIPYSKHTITFQSTPPVKAATVLKAKLCKLAVDFNPRRP